MTDRQRLVGWVAEETLVKSRREEADGGAAVNQRERQQAADVKVQVVTQSCGGDVRGGLANNKNNENEPAIHSGLFTLGIQSQVFGSIWTLKHLRILDLLHQQLQEV